MAQLNNYSRRNGPVEFRIVEYLGVLEYTKNGWAKEVNVVEWNGNPAKIDIREWDKDHIRMSRGVTLHEKEAIRLTDVLNRRYSSIDSRVRLDHDRLDHEERNEVPPEETFSGAGLDAGPLVDVDYETDDRSTEESEAMDPDEPFTRATASAGEELIAEAV